MFVASLHALAGARPAPGEAPQAVCSAFSASLRPGTHWHRPRPAFFGSRFAVTEARPEQFSVAKPRLPVTFASAVPSPNKKSPPPEKPKRVANTFAKQIEQKVKDIAERYAGELGLEIVNVVYDRSSVPSTLRVSIARVEEDEEEELEEEEDEDEDEDQYDPDADDTDVDQELDIEVMDADQEPEWAEEDEDEDDIEVDEDEIEYEEDPTVDDCEALSRHISEALDAAEIFGDEQYFLEVSSPGISDVLQSDRDFRTFKSFPVAVRTVEPFHKGQEEWTGTLLGRDERHVSINIKGRPVRIKRDVVAEVRLVTVTSEDF
eukprot:tig00000248_g21785.t1